MNRPRANQGDAGSYSTAAKAVPTTSSPFVDGVLEPCEPDLQPHRLGLIVWTMETARTRRANAILDMVTKREPDRRVQRHFYLLFLASSTPVSCGQAPGLSGRIIV